MTALSFLTINQTQLPEPFYFVCAVYIVARGLSVICFTSNIGIEKDGKVGKNKAKRSRSRVQCCKAGRENDKVLHIEEDFLI